MITYACSCGATLFFESTSCVSCHSDCGWCNACRTVASIEADPQTGEPRCGTASCREPAFPCLSQINWEACNARVASEGELCRPCFTTSKLPDLSVPDQLYGWRTMEAAKRRLIYDLDGLGVPWEASQPPLRFRFLADTATEHFTTGHQDGVITINLNEADPVEREKARQQFGEPQRTLIGHLRHETAHYLWQTHVAGKREEGSSRLFGDHTEPAYADAMPAYYEQGPPANWEEGYISAYATSHPWEDFAETVAFYLDMRSVVETVLYHFHGASSGSIPTGYQDLLAAYRDAGFGLNEVNRCLGLTDPLPEVVNPRVIAKLGFVDELLSQNST